MRHPSTANKETEFIPVPHRSERFPMRFRNTFHFDQDSQSAQAINLFVANTSNYVNSFKRRSFERLSDNYLTNVSDSFQEYLEAAISNQQCSVDHKIATNASAPEPERDLAIGETCGLTSHPSDLLDSASPLDRDDQGGSNNAVPDSISDLPLWELEPEDNELGAEESGHSEEGEAEIEPARSNSRKDGREKEGVNVADLEAKMTKPTTIYLDEAKHVDQIFSNSKKIMTNFNNLKEESTSVLSLSIFILLKSIATEPFHTQRETIQSGAKCSTFHLLILKLYCSAVCWRSVWAQNSSLVTIALSAFWSPTADMYMLFLSKRNSHFPSSCI